jgi:hypothetical protein
MFGQAGGVSHVFVFGAHCSGLVHVAGQVTVFPQLLVFVTLHAFPHVVAIGSGAQQLFEPLQTFVAAAQHAPLQMTADAHSHVLDVHV